MPWGDGTFFYAVFQGEENIGFLHEHFSVSGSREYIKMHRCFWSGLLFSEFFGFIFMSLTEEWTSPNAFCPVSRTCALLLSLP